MARSPQYKVFDAAGNYEGGVKHLEVAAGIVSILGEGASVRLGHSKKDTLWNEGKEDFSAGESYDHAAAIMEEREFRLRAEWKAAR